MDSFGLQHKNGVALRTNKMYSDILIYSGNYWGGENEKDMIVGGLTYEELVKMDWINWSDFVGTTKDMYESSWKSLARAVSIGEMQDVVIDMINHFIAGSGEQYQNETLTEKIANHNMTKKYIEDFMEQFKLELQALDGNVENLKDDNSKLRDRLRENNVFLTAYSYGGGFLQSDTWTGLTMSIHGWTQSDVTIKKLEINNDGAYNGVMNFRFIDNFGLDADDIDEFGPLAGFRAWFILQRYEKFNNEHKPFKVIVDIEYKFSGEI